MGKSVLSLFLISLLIGCGSDYTSDTNRDGTVDTTTTTTTVTDTVINETLAFSDVHAALNTKCLACHGTSGGFTLGSTAIPLAEAEAYNNILLFVTGAASAAETPLLKKATGGLSHGGGTVFGTDSYEYVITAAWIEAGGSLDVSFDVNTTTTVTTTTNPGYDEPTSPALSFIKNHYDGISPVQGQACIECHSRGGEDDIVRFGGTLSTYIHTENGEYYQDLNDYSVNVVGNMGSDFSAPVYSSTSITGHNNFYKSTSSNFVSGELFTVYVKDGNGNVVNQSATNTHSSATHRDCNSCHTKDGTNNAPGRVLAPIAE